MQSMLQRPNPHIQSLDDLFQRLVLFPQTLVVSLKPRVLGFEFFYASLESSAVRFHPLVLRVKHAVTENDSSEMRARLKRPAAVNSPLLEVDAYNINNASNTIPANAREPGESKWNLMMRPLIQCTP